MSNSFEFSRLPRRSVLKLMAGASLSPALLHAQTAAPPRRMMLDMVHNNPGEEPYQTRYNDPAVLGGMGYGGKVYSLFESPMLGVNWESVDPDIFPAGSAARQWVDAKAAQIDAQHTRCKAAGLATYAMADLILFPKSLVEKYRLQETFGDATDPQTVKFLRLLLSQTFDRFPKLDGLVFRIGETYLQDAPYHVGKILRNRDAQRTIIPLMRLLREEISVKRGRQVIFRSWLSFDTDLATYREVSAAVEPHPNLVIGVKHCEGDFHRGNPFSKVLGEGRHRQIVEVQCAREYEGKGAYPNYVANGVIEGFEEHRLQLPPEKIRSLREFERRSPLFAGLWTWTRGGGWRGPYIKNELWCDLNAWVLAQWGKDPAQTEEAVFKRYAATRLGLQGDDAAKFRRLCLLSADAVLRGKTSTHSDISPWWSRDNGINRPELPADPLARARVIAEKAESVGMWREIVALARAIRFPDAATGEYVVTSSRYGSYLYRIYRILFDLEGLGRNGDKARMRALLSEYDAAWAEYRKLPTESASCATLYEEKSAPVGAHGDGIDKVIAEYRAAAGS
jgi:hypothetical protein